jgi:hypothetical protein
MIALSKCLPMVFAVCLLEIPALGQTAPPPPARAVQAGRPAIDFTQTILGIDGKAILELPSGGPPLTLSEVAVTALVTMTADDQRMPGIEKFKLDVLARKVYNNKSAELSAEEIATIKDRIGKVCSPPIVGAAWRLLDPAQK